MNVDMERVVRQWRRQGLATALKAHNLELVSLNGLRMIRTVHHPGNLAMIALNRELGFVDAWWEYPSQVCTFAALARSLGVSRQSVNEMLVGPERQSLLEVISDPASRSSKLVRTTALGAACIQTAFSIFDELQDELRKRIGNNTADQLESSLSVD